MILRVIVTNMEACAPRNDYENEDDCFAKTPAKYLKAYWPISILIAYPQTLPKGPTIK